VSATTTEVSGFSNVFDGCYIGRAVFSTAATGGWVDSGGLSTITGCFTGTDTRIGIAPGRSLACTTRFWTAATGLAGREGWSGALGSGSDDLVGET
jgi:hypothetical protein